MLEIHTLLDGQEHLLHEEDLLPASTVRQMRSWNTVDGEDLSPYEEATREPVWETGPDLNPGRAMIHADAEMAWSRFVIPLGYLTKIVGGGFSAYQVGFADPYANPATFKFTFKPGESGMQIREAVG